MQITINLHCGIVVLTNQFRVIIHCRWLITLYNCDGILCIGIVVSVFGIVGFWIPLQKVFHRQERYGTNSFVLLTQPAHDVRTTLLRRCFNVVMSFQRPCNVIRASCASWVFSFFFTWTNCFVWKRSKIIYSVPFLSTEDFLDLHL